MPKEQFIEFLAKASGDKDLEGKITNANDSNSIVALGSASGFTFTVEDIKEGAADLKGIHEGELTQEQLKMVSGGGWFKAIKIYNKCVVPKWAKWF